MVQLEDKVNTTNASQSEPMPQPEATQVAKRMLFRHPTDKLVGGVCAGIADFLAIEPALVRIGWVILTLATGGGGVLAYLALWILLPVGTMEAGQLRPATIELNERNLVRAAAVLIGLGGLWLLANIGVLPWMWGTFWHIFSIIFWPALLIGAGYMLLQRAGKGNWGVNLGDSFQRMRGSVGEKMPTTDEMKDGVKQAQRRFPLKRSRTDRIFLGVCGGIGKALRIDANLVRLVWAAFSISSIGMGVLIYVALGVLLPEEPEEDEVGFYTPEQDVQIIDVSATSGGKN